MPLGRGLSSLIPSFKNNPVGERAPTAREPSEAEGKDRERIWHIPLSSIRPNPYQPRRGFSHQDLEELVNSIKEHGVIQPLLVTETEDGGYELIAGERRLRAAQILGLPTAPAIIHQAKNWEKLELALIENIQRKDLNPIEEAFAYERLVDEFGLRHEDIAKKIGKSRPYVSNMLRLLTLPAEIQKGLIEGAIHFSVARAILGLSTIKEQLKMYRRVVETKGTSSQVEEEAEGERLKTPGLTRRDPLILDYEQKLREVLGTKVRIAGRGEKGNIRIDYYSLEELRRIIKSMLGK